MMLTAQDLRRAGWYQDGKGWTHQNTPMYLFPIADRWHARVDVYDLGTVFTIDDLRKVLEGLHVEGGIQ